MKKLVLIILALGTSAAFANTQTILCKNNNGTIVKMRETSDGVTLFALRVKGFNFLIEGRDEIPCERYHGNGSPTHICDLGNGYKTSVFPRNYTPHSGLIIYSHNRSIDDDLGLICDFE